MLQASFSPSKALVSPALALSGIRVFFITGSVSRLATKGDIMDSDRCSVEILHMLFANLYCMQLLVDNCILELLMLLKF